MTEPVGAVGRQLDIEYDAVKADSLLDRLAEGMVFLQDQDPVDFASRIVGVGNDDALPVLGLADIVKNIEPTAQIVSRIKPIYNFKAGDEE